MYLFDKTQLGCIGTVLTAQQAPKEEKGMWMHRHKSLGLLSGMIVLPRVAYRLGNMAAYKVRNIPGVGELEHQAARYVCFRQKILYTDL